MSARRVVITGLGCLSALGLNTPSYWASLREGRSGIRPLERVDRSQLRCPIGAEVPGYDMASYFDAKQQDMLDRFAQFAILAGQEAISDSRLEWTPELRRRTAVITGCCTPGQDTLDAGFLGLYVHRKRVPTLTVPRVMASAGASHITMRYGFTGPAFTVSSACSSANHAIGQAFWMVRQGMAEVAIAGGSEAPFSFGNLKAWESLRVLSQDTCRPFSRNRSGMVLGEGGAMLVLEPLEAAVARGAVIHAEVVGYGMSSDASHLTNPSSDGAAAAMLGALADAGIGPEQVGYINAHGTGTSANDPMEAAAIRAAFGAHASRLAVSSTKSMHGHALGAAGALEAVATVLALEHGVLPPTANFTEPDPACDLDVIPNEARPAQVEYALSNSFAFGGLNAVLAFRRWTG